MKIHPHYSVTVTPALEEGGAAYVGQNLMRNGNEVVGGVLCRVACGDTATTNNVAQQIADAWNATPHLRTEEPPQ